MVYIGGSLPQLKKQSSGVPMQKHANPVTIQTMGAFGDGVGGRVSDALLNFWNRLHKTRRALLQKRRQPFLPFLRGPERRKPCGSLLVAERHI